MFAVTVSRQSGSKGNEIAQLLAERLDFQFISEAEIHRLAEDCDSDYKDACSAYEQESFRSIIERFSFDRPAYRSLFEGLNYELASRGKVVMLGRGMQIVLKDIPGILHVRIVAPVDVKVKRIAETKGITESDALEFLQKQDSRRRHVFRSIYNYDPDDPMLYDLCLNTAYYNEESASEVLVTAFTGKDSQESEKSFEKLSNLAFAKRVESKVRKLVSSVSMYEAIQVSADIGKEVTLKGFVRSQKDSQIAEKTAREHQGVTGVHNKISVVSGF